MSKEEAFDTLKQVAAAYVGTLQDHNQIQEALNIINAILKKSEK
jgi:predicted RNase H-like HicB family nuclease